MPFNKLLLCALEHDCSHTESGVTAALRSPSGTAILLFKLDKHAEESRKALGLGPDQKLCDLLYYVVARRDRELRRLLCFVECKGTDHDQAVRQLEATAMALRARLPGGVPEHVPVIGAVRSDVGSSSPRRKGKRKCGRPDGEELPIEVCPSNDKLWATILRHL